MEVGGGGGGGLAHGGGEVLEGGGGHAVRDWLWGMEWLGGCLYSRRSSSFPFHSC